MSKQKSIQQKADAKAKRREAPRIEWKNNRQCAVTGKDYWVPVIHVANLAIPLDERPFRGFKDKERDAVMTYIQMAVSEILFGVPKFIAHQGTGKHIQHNPDWEQLPVFVECEGDEWAEIVRTPKDIQALKQDEASKPTKIIT